MQEEYYKCIVKGERIPDVTLVIEEPAEVIVSRMEYRLARLEGPAPKVWQQAPECYQRIMDTFRGMLSDPFSVYSYYVTSQSIGYKLEELARSISR